jgi:hypothetical protein
MDSVPDDIPDELKEDWGKLLTGGDERKMRRHLELLHGAVDTASNLEADLRSAFEGKKPEDVDPATRTTARTTLVSSLQSHSLFVGAIQKIFSKLSADGQGVIRRVLGWIAERLVTLLTEFSAHLKLENWSVAAQFATFPPGASFTFTLTFQ